MRLLLVHSLLFPFSLTQAAVTAYGPHVQSPLGTMTAPSASYTGAASYDQTTLVPPDPPNPPPPTQFKVELQSGDVSGLSIQQEGSFFGFSIEFSVTTQIRKYCLPEIPAYPLNVSGSRAQQVTNRLRY